MPKRDYSARTLSKAWQDQFHSFLVGKRLAAEEKAKYLVRWVERFLQTADADATSEANATKIRP